MFRVKHLTVLLLLLTGCKTIDVEVRADQTCHMKYTGWGKIDIKDLNAQVCGGSLGVGSSSSDTPSGLSTEAIACLLAPQLCVK